MSPEIVASRCALVIVDLVNDILKPGAPFEAPEAREEIVPRLKPLLELARAKGMTLVYTRFVSQSGEGFGADPEGTEFYEEIRPQAQDIVVNKSRYTPFYGANLDLEEELRRRGVDTVIVAGCSTAVGCEAAARDAHTRRFNLILLSDGVVTRDIPDMGWGFVAKDDVRRVVLSLMAYRFGTVLSVADLTEALRQP